MKPAWVLIAFLWFAYLLNHADRQVVYTLLPALQKEFGYTDGALGLLGAVFLWVYGAGSPFAGILGDRVSKRKIIAASVLIWSGFTALSGFAPNGTMLLLCRGLLGISECLFMPAALALAGTAHAPETRSKALAIFMSGQLCGVALGGSLAGYIAEHLHWRAAFWIFGATGALFSIPFWAFLRGFPEAPPAVGAARGSIKHFVSLLKIPTLRIVTIFVAISTFALFLVYSWLATFIAEKFHLGLARAGFEASVYGQIGNAIGLLAGGALADRLFRVNKASRYWVIVTGFLLGGPCVFWIGNSPTLEMTRIATIAFGLCHGFIASNQVACSYDVVPAGLRASTVGVLNLLGGAVSGFAPFLGGLSRRTIGVDRLMTFTAILMWIAAGLIVYGVRRHFERDHAKAREAA